MEHPEAIVGHVCYDDDTQTHGVLRYVQRSVLQQRGTVLRELLVRIDRRHLPLSLPSQPTPSWGLHSPDTMEGQQCSALALASAQRLLGLVHSACFLLVFPGDQVSLF